MSLRTFHLLFIALSVVLTAFMAAWAGAQYAARHEAVYVATAIGSLAAGAALVVYAMAFVKKTKRLS